MFIFVFVVVPREQTGACCSLGHYDARRSYVVRAVSFCLLGLLFRIKKNLNYSDFYFVGA